MHHAPRTPGEPLPEPQEILTPDGTPFNWAAFEGYDAAPEARRNGWTAERRRTFLEALSDGHSVTHACRIVGMSKRSAYSLRQSPRGAAFALGWDAAQLLQRNAIADACIDRALNGVVDTLTDEDGVVTRRHRHDNRLAMAMLTRLDRAVDARAGGPAFAAARLIAQDFEAWLDLVAGEAPPARAALFLAAGLGSDAAGGAGEDELAPLRALARADRRLREVSAATQDADQATRLATLDPARRAEWTAADWALAEAAGLIVLAPPAPEPEPEPEDPAASRARDGNGEFGKVADPENPTGEPVWWCRYADAWRTRFPPPEGFDGEEDGRFGDPDYQRALTVDEELAMEDMEAQETPEIAERRIAEAHDRDRWFGFTLPTDTLQPPPADEAPPPDEGAPEVPRKAAEAVP